ncbi:hypothetical protein MMC07_000011 [Pseudocyphellaria aurata]|nr:hypothetical protein [Pseudocyphellaria aurata]
MAVQKQTTSTRKAKPREVRRSARLKAILQLEESSRRKYAEAGLSSTARTSQDQAQASPSNKSPLKRKRGQEAPYSSQDPLHSKRPRTSTRHTAEGRPQEAEKPTSTAVADPLQSWCFEPDDRAREELLEYDSWLEEIIARPSIPDVQYVERNGFRYPLPVKKAPASLRREQSDSSLTKSSDLNQRDSKSTPYRDTRYTTMLETKGTFLRDFDYKVPKAITDVCHQLLARDQIVPQNSLFCDDLFGRLCWKIQDRNEAMIVQDITRLLVPSAMNLAMYGDKNLDILIENISEAWAGAIPVEGPRPQPDYTVGFDRAAFTDEQLENLLPLCGAAALDIADRQNVHSMTVAVRGVVELFKAVKREEELDREILAFSISHDHRSVRIYGHYPVIDGDKVTFYRHPIREFSFVEMDGREKWTTYKFTKNIYDIWMPTHLQRICSAIDQLPSGLDFEVSEGPGVQFEEATGPSQDMGSLLSGPSDNAIALQISQEDDELISIVPQTATPDTSVSKGGRQGAAKRANKNPLKK